MKTWLLALLTCLSIITYAQTDTSKDKYTIKDKRIYRDGKDITDKFSKDTRKAIFRDVRAFENKHKRKQKRKQRREERQLKKKEKTLKKDKKAISNFEKAQAKLKKAEAKYLRLKTKGKLSPVEDSKWSKKIEKLNAKVEKYQKRL